MKHRRYAAGVVLLLLLAPPREPGAGRTLALTAPALVSLEEPGRLLDAAPAPAVEVELLNVNTRERRRFLLTPEGEVLGGQEERAALDRFFRCKRTGRTHAMAPGVLAKLAAVGARYPDRVIEIVSGFRRRGFGTRRSKHFVGRAIDLRVRGVPTGRVRAYLWSRYDAELGLGHYHRQGFLHVDHRPGEEKVGWQQRRPGASYRVNPWWTD